MATSLRRYVLINSKTAAVVSNTRAYDLDSAMLNFYRQGVRRALFLRHVVEEYTDSGKLIETHFQGQS